MKMIDKNGFVTLVCLGLALITSCSDDVDPAVSTLYFDSPSRAVSREGAFLKLYEFYIRSDKSKEYYELIARKSDQYIVNYYPAGQLLTVCQDPGSGWSDQIKNVSDVRLKSMANSKISLDSLRNFVAKDSLLEQVNPFIPIKTNGKPSL